MKYAINIHESKRQSLKKIPFNRPFIVGKELYYIAQAVQSGHLAGDGVFTKKCNEWMEREFDAKRVLLTNSGTASRKRHEYRWGVTAITNTGWPW